MERKGTYFHYIQCANYLFTKGVVCPKLDKLRSTCKFGLN